MLTMMTLLLLAAPIISLLVSLLATRWLASHGVAGRGPMDLPNARSLHSTPVPRTGGLAVLLGLLLSLPTLAVPGIDLSPLIWPAAALALVAGVSFFDDLGEAPAWMRLLAHLLAAILLLAGGLGWFAVDLPGLTLPLPTILAGVLTLFHVVWMINLYNFMDGMDGLAAGMTICGFSALAVLGWSGGEPLFALAAICVAAAAGGFLTGNFPPARIFLGDTGSSSLGLLAAAFSLWGVQLGLFPLWTAWLAFSPFIVDATWTLLTRLARRERVWEAHRSHHYQRLVLAGWSHRQVLQRAYPLMMAAAACAVASPRLPAHEQWFLLGGWAAIYVLIHIKVGLVERAAAPDRDDSALDRP
ncbi:glycosyl transferase [Thiobaca trueperi]|uniref:UDP-N-acetylmuramyl pentapeptide phosphotransferase/UDP-N-acetylglucosamine-1-phosphate transferase n=1 Tax=Thiobaca trueperi TaxID=127458 RepID=A0A4V6NZX4_9GAMM|nr:glycosyl transferase [Thiobaca trueperi]TCT20182.1 UDP-N-acetylmuramyl pentapeptide phosphotransferase/UDP-N-acetylglucosamine-1-phosphate transferase [Thiobaca trueperi]